MGPITLCLAVAVVGIDVGWKPIPGGGVEYIIQIPPEAVDAVRSGQPIQSDIPSQVTDIRAYRIVVGTGRLPKELPRYSAAPPQRTPEETAARVPPATEQESPAATDNPFKTVAKPPRTFSADPSGKPIAAENASFTEPAATADDSDANSTEQQPPDWGSSPKPWMPFTAVLVGLFASLGGCAFLGWIVLDQRHRYRALLESAER